MVKLLKYLISSLLLISFISCAAVPTMYKVGKVVTPVVVKDKDKLEQLEKVDEIVSVIGGAISAPKSESVNTLEVLTK